MNQPFSLVIAPLSDIDERGTAQTFKAGFAYKSIDIQMTGFATGGTSNLAPQITKAESLVVAVGLAGFKQQNCYFTQNSCSTREIIAYDLIDRSRDDLLIRLFQQATRARSARER